MGSVWRALTSDGRDTMDKRPQGDAIEGTRISLSPVDGDGSSNAPVATEEADPGDVGTLSLRYVDGVPVIVVSGGTAIPARLNVIDPAGATVSAYEVAAGTGMARGLQAIVNYSR
jgi:hypothetical protein